MCRPDGNGESAECYKNGNVYFNPYLFRIKIVCDKPGATAKTYYGSHSSYYSYATCQATGYELTSYSVQYSSPQ